ncbi:hypothetical protein CROQUDRAFT_94907 [Cronartium quercuum f. sp. fusiforme G11]|uniref:Uncharacterized protein n=1 Tax=Cronartium quercuum f. sp. fusiforme G11 TaxID=708437 RepID=A0A9P6T9W6_9BASI|nr:hypothetical protein CROQUDRAFT_94907 [Cronartium quercuum f. sp. fusiforme G11]
MADHEYYPEARPSSKGSANHKRTSTIGNVTSRMAMYINYSTDIRISKCSPLDLAIWVKLGRLIPPSLQKFISRLLPLIFEDFNLREGFFRTGCIPHQGLRLIELEIELDERLFSLESDQVLLCLVNIEKLHTQLSNLLTYFRECKALPKLKHIYHHLTLLSLARKTNTRINVVKSQRRRNLFNLPSQ